MTGKGNETKSTNGGTTQKSSATGWSYHPRFDVIEDADEFALFIDLPGATADGIQITIDNRVLSIHGAVPTRQPRETEYLTQEYGVGDFDREVVLPDVVDPDRINAEYDHGVLTVHLPKAEEAKPRRIPIRATAPKAT